MPAITVSRSAGVSVLFKYAAATPSTRRPSTWSFISEMSGDTTSATPRRLDAAWLLDHRRRLEAQRLPSAGRKHDDAVAAFEDGLHRLALEWTEIREAPDAVQRLPEERVGSANLVIG